MTQSPNRYRHDVESEFVPFESRPKVFWGAHVNVKTQLSCSGLQAHKKTAFAFNGSTGTKPHHAAQLHASRVTSS